MYRNLTPSEIMEGIDKVSEKILKGNNTPWVIFPSIKMTKADFEKYSKNEN